MTGLRMVALAAGLLLASLWTGGASAAPVAQGGGIAAPMEIEQVQRHWRHPRQRCWWETRRFRDHRGRWVHRRVQVCTR